MYQHQQMLFTRKEFRNNRESHRYKTMGKSLRVNFESHMIRLLILLNNHQVWKLRYSYNHTRNLHLHQWWKIGHCVWLFHNFKSLEGLVGKSYKTKTLHQTKRKHKSRTLWCTCTQVLSKHYSQSTRRNLDLLLTKLYHIHRRLLLLLLCNHHHIARH